MKFLGGIAGNNLSGSLGGVTASRNRFGSYFRNRSIPVNPGTPFQTTIRGLMATLTSLWIDTLSQGGRDAWTVYADNVPLIDALGQPIFVTGLNMYVRTNIPLLQAGGTRVDGAPSIFNLGSFTGPTMTAAASGAALTIAFNTLDDWVSEDNALMMVSGSRPQNPTINFFKGPYRFAGSIVGDTALPPTSPVVITNPFGIATGQKVFAQVRVVRADGRLSGTFRLESLVV